MIKKRLIHISYICILSIVMAMLAGCSEGGSSVSGTPLSENLNSEGVHIWYECQNKIEAKDSSETYSLEEIMGEDDETSDAPQFGRETRVVWIKVYKDGKLTSYSCSKNVYLGFFAKMTDEEILQSLESDTDTFICGQKDEPFEIYLYSDATGHEIVYEGIPSVIKQSKKSDPMYFMTLVSANTVPAFQVYDSYYGGYALYNYDETPFGEACLVTRCEEGTVFGLDSMELEGAIVDYATPEDMLHEKNDALKKSAKKADKETAADEEAADSNQSSEDQEQDGNEQADAGEEGSSDSEGTDAAEGQ